MKHSLLFGLLCSPVGIGVGIILRINDWGIASGDGYGLGFISSAGIAAFLAPCFIWYIMIERRERISVSRGIIERRERISVSRDITVGICS